MPAVPRCWGERPGCPGSVPAMHKTRSQRFSPMLLMKGQLLSWHRNNPGGIFFGALRPQLWKQQESHSLAWRPNSTHE